MFKFSTFKSMQPYKLAFFTNKIAITATATAAATAAVVSQARTHTSFAPSTNSMRSTVIFSSFSTTTSTTKCTSAKITPMLSLAFKPTLIEQRRCLSTRNRKNVKRFKKSKSVFKRSKSNDASSDAPTPERGKENKANQTDRSEQLEYKSRTLYNSADNDDYEIDAAWQKEFSEKWSKCFSISYEEFMLGAHQAYYAIGGAMKLLDAELPNTKIANKPIYTHDDATQVFAEVVKDKFEIKTRELLNNTETIKDEQKMEEQRKCLQELATNTNIWHFHTPPMSASWCDKTHFAQFMERIVPAFNSFMPCSIAFTHSIFQLWWGQHLNLYNLRMIAGPTDYIVSSEVVLFTSLPSCDTEFVDPRGEKPSSTSTSTRRRRRLQSNNSSSDEEENADTKNTNDDNNSNTNDSTDETKSVEENISDTEQFANSSTTAATPLLYYPILWWNKLPFVDKSYVMPEWNSKMKKLIHESEQLRIWEHNLEGEEKKKEIEIPIVMTEMENFITSPSSSSSSTTTALPNDDNENNNKGEFTKANNESKCEEQQNKTSTAKQSRTIIKEIPGNAEVKLWQEHNKFRVKVNNITEFYAPHDARALAVIMLDVAIPPSRRFDEYDAMYSFTSSIKGIFKRAAIARFIAAMGFGRVLRSQDYLMRVLTGESLKDMYLKTSLPLMDVPADIENSVPTVRKYLCLYMDSAKQWNVSSIIWQNPLQYTPVPSV